MGMLSVCYVKVRAMLKKCKIEMLSLGYGSVKTRLRQIALSPTPARVKGGSRVDQGSRTYRSWKAGKLK